MYTVIVVVVLIVMFLASAIRILNEYQRAVIFRLGRIIATKGPGDHHPHTDHRQDGQDRHADDHDGCSAAGRHHPGQCVH